MKPTRSKEEVIKILEEKCHPCKYFEPTMHGLTGGCRKCGCMINDRGPGEGLNKLSMKTEHCEVGGF